MTTTGKATSRPVWVFDILGADGTIRGLCPPLYKQQLAFLTQCFMPKDIECEINDGACRCRCKCWFQNLTPRMTRVCPTLAISCHEPSV